MQKNEFHQFMESNLGQRWPQWQPNTATMNDWWLVLKDYTVNEAERAVHQHKTSDKAIVSEPKISEVLKFLKERSSRGQEERQAYTPWIRCLEAPPEHPDWEDEEWVRIDAGWRPQNCWEKDYVARFAQKVAKQVEVAEGGRWCGVVRLDDDYPDNQPGPALKGKAAKEWACKHILNGPDGPGKRWLQRQDKAVFKTI
jgi:hypothetical protein